MLLGVIEPERPQSLSHLAVPVENSDGVHGWELAYPGGVAGLDNAIVGSVD